MSGTHMNLIRKRLEVGQDYCSDDGGVQGAIIKVWPVESGSEALIRLHSTSKVVRVFIPGEQNSERG